jgi:hypothetical protein
MHIVIDEPCRNATWGRRYANILMKQQIRPKGIKLCGKGWAEAVKFLAVIIEFGNKFEQGGSAFCDGSSGSLI